MQTNFKEWLVRTKNREILGPYSQRELVDELNKKTFTVDDEISSIGGYWVSAQSLWARDVEEVTHTSTRNQTLTGSVTASETSEPKIALDRGEFTPTPEALPPLPSRRRMRAAVRAPKTAASKTIPVIASLVLVIGLTTFLLKKHPSQDRPISSNLTLPTSGDCDSPFVRDIYVLIESGETATALKKLTEYHEKGQKKEDLCYLVPYSALLITEGESPGRARKFLEQVISSTQASPRLKSRAHHWLGYLLLSQDEADMGESHFLEALQLNPRDAAARFNLGRAYLKQEKFSQALDYLQLAEVEIPDLWLVHIYKGRAKVALGDMEAARNSFKTAIQASPDRWITYIYYSLYLVGVRDYEEARSTLRKMLTRDPHYELHSPPPMGFYQEKINYGEYLNAFTHVMEKATPEEKEVGKLYINYLMNGGQEEDFKRFDTLAERGTLLPKVIDLKVLLDKNAGATEFKAALQRLPQNLSSFGPYAYVLRGDAKVRMGLYGEAQEDFLLALKLDPKCAVAHWALARLLERQQKKEDSQQEIHNLLIYHPNYIPAIINSHQF